MYNGARNRQDMAERICQSEGHNPSHTLTDKLYRNRDNLLYCKEEDIHLSGPMTGMRYRDQCRAKEHDLLNKCECIFSLAKHKCGMGLATAMLQETAAHVLAMSV